MSITASHVPELVFGAGSRGEIGKRAAAMAGGASALVLADGFLEQSGVAAAVAEDLARHGLKPHLLALAGGEPSLSRLAEPIALARREEVGLIVGMGGGSALDSAKVVAACAAGEPDPRHYALAAAPLPDTAPRKILVPTTAGTGSEANGIAVFADETGRKLWLYGPQAKPDLAVLDPELTVPLPASLTAWCGMDAFVHAFESATVRRTNPVIQVYAHKALGLICGAVGRAVRSPDDLEARGDMLLGAFLAGYAIENAGTSIGHCISHALAALGTVHHGHATALAFEATLPWLVEGGAPALEGAARRCGLEDSAGLPGFVTDMMDGLAVQRLLPESFAAIGAEALAAQMRAPENRPMLKATPRPDTEAAVGELAARFMAHVGAPGKAA